jgi:hypothetical protein
VRLAVSSKNLSVAGNRKLDTERRPTTYFPKKPVRMRFDKGAGNRESHTRWRADRHDRCQRQFLALHRDLVKVFHRCSALVRMAPAG